MPDIAQMMTRDLIQDRIDALTPARKAHVEECAERIRVLVRGYGPAGYLALAVVGSQVAASDESDPLHA